MNDYLQQIRARESAHTERHVISEVLRLFRWVVAALVVSYAVQHGLTFEIVQVENEESNENVEAQFVA